jgi:hypothetical protein
MLQGAAACRPLQRGSDMLSMDGQLCILGTLQGTNAQKLWQCCCRRRFVPTRRETWYRASASLNTYQLTQLHSSASSPTNLVGVRGAHVCHHAKTWHTRSKELFFHRPHLVSGSCPSAGLACLSDDKCSRRRSVRRYSGGTCPIPSAYPPADDVLLSDRRAPPVGCQVQSHSPLHTGCNSVWFNNMQSSPDSSAARKYATAVANLEVCVR